MAELSGIFIGLGSNLGQRERHIRDGLRELTERGDVWVVACSGLYESEAVGGPAGQPSYLNAVAELSTNLLPRELLLRMQHIETRHERVRVVPNGPRTLDLDLLLYRDRVIDDPDLSVPHPRMWQREFVMRPLAEICDLGRMVAARRLRLRHRVEADAHVLGYTGGAEALA